MEKRLLSRAGRKVSVVGLGTWQFGDGWAHVAEGDVRAILDAAVESGVDFIDTADVYGAGRSERLIGLLPGGLRTRCPFMRRHEQARHELAVAANEHLPQGGLEIREVGGRRHWFLLPQC